MPHRSKLANHLNYYSSLADMSSSLGRHNLLDFIIITFLVTLAYWTYNIPILKDFGNHIMGSDDASYALLARRTLYEGLAGAFHMTWSPLLPWIMAGFEKYLHISIDDNIRLISSWALTLKIIPVYILGRLVFSRKVGLLAAIFVYSLPLAKISLGSPFGEPLLSLTLTIALTLSVIAIKYDKNFLFFLSGAAWSLSYLTRLEGWFPILGFILITLIQKKTALKKIVNLSFVAFGFLLFSFPYISFVHKYYGLWTLNGRLGISLTAPGNPYDMIKDQNGMTTLGQVMISGDPYYYQSNLWHPKLIDILTKIGRRQSPDDGAIYTYLQIFYRYSPYFLITSLLGLLLFIFKISYKNTKSVLYLFAFFISLYLFIEIIIIFLGSLPLAYDSTVLKIIRNLFKLRFGKYYKPGLLPKIILDFLILVYLIKSKRNITKLIKNHRDHQEIFLLFYTLIFGVIPLCLHTVEDRFLIWMVPLLAIFAAYFIIEITKKFFSSNSIVLCVIMLFLIKPDFFTLLNLRNDYMYSRYNDDPEKRMFKNTGEAVYTDYGPGATVSVFRSSPAYYARGKPFYYIKSENLDLQDTLKYFYDNHVDYIVAAKWEVYQYPVLQPLLDPKLKLKHWELIYIDPKIPLNEYYFAEEKTNVVATVWKRK